MQTFEKGQKQPSRHSCTELRKTQFFQVSIVKELKGTRCVKSIFIPLSTNPTKRSNTIFQKSSSKFAIEVFLLSFMES